MVRTAVVVVAMAAQALAPAAAQSLDSAIATVTSIDDALMSSMRHAGGPDQVASAIDADFNVSAMSEFIVGSAWAGMSASDRSAVTAAVRRYLIARLAHEFDTYSGEQFRVDSNVQARGPDRLVHTEVVTPGEDPTRLDYRLRAYVGTWRVIDIYYNGVSEVTTQRADLASTQPGGATAIIARIEQATRAIR